VLPLFCGFAAGAEAIAGVAERLALISARSKRLVHDRVTCARDGSAWIPAAAVFRPKGNTDAQPVQ
jgi:hypothetical protein